MTRMFGKKRPKSDSCQKGHLIILDKLFLTFRNAIGWFSFTRLKMALLISGFSTILQVPHLTISRIQLIKLVITFD
jgi:hypothetical protein